MPDLHDDPGLLDFEFRPSTLPARPAAEAAARRERQREQGRRAAHAYLSAVLGGAAPDQATRVARRATSRAGEG